MPTPTVRVFVSSTWLDLQPERAAVKEVVLRIQELQFSGMEHFGSRDETTEEASLDAVEDSHVYVGILAARYSSGITEKEYRRARERRLPCFIYFKDGATITDDCRESDPAQMEKLDALRRELRANHLISPPFINPQDLAAKVATDLHRWLIDEYLSPKLRQAASGQAPRAEAQALLDAVKDLSALNRDLLARLKEAGYNVASGGRGVVFTGEAGQVSINTGDTNIYNVPVSAVSALHQLRAPVGDFVGREKEIEMLTGALRSGGAAGISGISGMGGIGKTELALYVANRLRDAYPDAQLFVDMRGTDERPRDPADALADCIRAFAGPEQRLPESLDDLTKLYRAALTGKRALVLLDNASDAPQVRPLLPPAGSALLVTSRGTIPLPGMKRLTLEQLQPAEARELLMGIAPRVPPDTADQICFLCGYLPLAVRAAGSLLDITADLDPADYADQLRDERTRLARIGTEGVDVDVEASLSLSYQRLSPDEARVFRQLSVFPESFDAAAEEAVCEDRGHKHLSALLRRNLVLYNTDTARYRLHDLARLFAAARVNEDEGNTSQMRHAVHYVSVLGRTKELYLQGGKAIKSGLALFDLEWRNIQAGQSWTAKQSGENDAAASVCNAYPDAGAYVLSLRQHWRERILWLEAALAAARRLIDRMAEGAHLGNLGVAYAQLGDYRRAIEIEERALVVEREIGNRRGEGDVLGILGNIYAELNETARAVEFYEQQLAITREIGDRRGEGIALGNLGAAYAELGEKRRAIELYEQRLAIARDTGDRKGESYALGNLGNAYLASDEAHRAVEMFNQVLIVAREMNDRYSEGNALFNAGLALKELGDRDQAIARAEAALEIFEQIESPNAAKVRAALALWHRRE